MIIQNQELKRFNPFFWNTITIITSEEINRIEFLFLVKISFFKFHETMQNEQLQYLNQNFSNLRYKFFLAYFTKQNCGNSYLSLHLEYISALQIKKQLKSLIIITLQQQYICRKTKNMNQKTPKQHFSDEQKIEQLREDIEMIKRKMDQEYIQKLNNKNDPIYNIFLLGPSGSGKSTMANELIDVRIVFQSEDDETFNCSSKQNKDMKFKISEESMRSETDKPQEYRVNQYQLWDLPGYFDCRCKYKDLKNIVSSQSLIQHSEYSQILIVIPASQFFDYKLEKLIKILDNIEISNCEISLSLVISMVNGQKLDYFLKKLNDLLKSDILKTGRELLLKILVQNRVIIFECPKQDPKNEDFYYFCQENIKSIKAQVFQTNRFTKFHQLKLNPPDETKIIQWQIEQYYSNVRLLQGEDLFKEINDQNRFKYEKPPFIQQLEQLEENINPILQRIKYIQNNIIIIGESGAGKSTLCNIMMNKNLIFKYEQMQFKPIEEVGQLQFKISSDCTMSQTNVPKVEQISDNIQICDVPGLQDTKSGLNDILTSLNIQLIVNNSHAIQIVLVIPAKEFTDNKFKNLIEILNQFQENTFTLTFLITHADEYQTKEFFCEELEKLLDLQETKFTNKAKQLLKRSLINKEERIMMLQQPIESEQEDLYSFNQDQIKSIQKNLLSQQYFDKLNLVFSFTDVNKQEIKAQSKILLEIQDQIWKILFKVSIKRYIMQRSFLLPNDKQKEQYLCELEKNYKKQCFQNLDNINHLRLLIPEYNQLDNQYENHINELKNITNILEVDQQLSTIRIFCSFMSISKLSQILQKHNQFDKVFIYSLIQFQVDQSFTYPGLSIYIKTKEFVVTSQNYVQINLKGNDGARIHPSKAGQEMINPKNGENGKSGNNGQNGGNLYVDSQLYHNMDLLIIDVSGGNGSDGQDGGDGQDGENGKDADQQHVDQKDTKYQVDYLEQIIEEKNQQNQNEDQAENNLPVKQEDILQQESNTLNKFNVVLLEQKGYPGSVGGNSGVGGIGGLKGFKGQVNLTTLHKPAKLIDQDGSNGVNGKNGIVGKGGLQGKNYKRAYWDVKYCEGGLSKTKIFLYVIGSIFSFGTLFMGLSLASLAQFLFKDGNWLTNGDFIQENIRADDGKINVRKSQIRLIEKVDNIKNISEFNQFVVNQRGRRNSSIYQCIID
ncbi:hypothetical protein pb186bvf_001733 [Paramecium bursaria]